MQSSYSLIKKDRALSGEIKNISTRYEKNYETVDEIINQTGITVEDAQKYIENYENIGKNIIEDAKAERERIMVEAYTKADLLEREAYERGYEQGLKNGYDDGKNESINKYIPEAENRALNIVGNAERILKSAENDYKNYLESKEKEIINLAIAISEKILNKEVAKDYAITELVEEALSIAKGEKNIIIKCNSIYKDELKKHIETWKTSYSINGSIFVLSDDTITQGNVIVEKDNGIIQLGIDIGLEEIKKVILG